VTEEVFPGFKFSVFSYVVSLLRPEIIRDLELPRHGLHILPLESTLTPLDNGDYLAQWSDHDQNRARARAPLAARRRGVRRVRPADAPDGARGQADPRDGAAGSVLARIRAICARCPLRRPYFRGLGAERFHALWKLITMSAADYPRRVVRDRSAQGDEVGERHHRHVPRPALPGHAYVLLHHYMGEIDGVFRAWGFAKGGNGSVSAAIASAARAHGA
jgi:phytoene dehydrogenase-like protein